VPHAPKEPKIIRPKKSIYVYLFSPYIPVGYVSG
jgi:hypothetical protein